MAWASSSPAGPEYHGDLEEELALRRARMSLESLRPVLIALCLGKEGVLPKLKVQVNWTAKMWKKREKWN